MKIINFIIFFFILGFTYQQEPLYNKVVVAKIKEDSVSGISRLFDINGNLNINGPEILINEIQINKLEKIINDTLTYGAKHSFSHFPTIAVIYYKDDKIIDWLEIALSTNSLNSKHRIKSQWKYYTYIFDEIYPLSGISAIGRKELRNWFKNVGIEDNGSTINHWDSTKIDLKDLNRKY